LFENNPDVEASCDQQIRYPFTSKELLWPTEFSYSFD
jgi:hypothetical protein